MKKHNLVAMLGTAISYYDISLYTYMAPILTLIFLPKLEIVQAYSLYFAFETLTVFSRPVGAFFLGKIGDKYGRKKALLISIFGNCIATFLIAFIPSYASIGIFATVLFVSLRILQNFFLSGEYNGGAIYCLENTKPSYNGFASGLYCAFTSFGIITASLVVTIITHIDNNYWRIAYLLSFVFSIFTFYLRKKLIESSEFINAQPQKLNLKFKINAISLVISLTMFFGLLSSLPTKVFNVILPLAINIKSSQIILINTGVLVIYSAFLLVMGKVTDKIGNKLLLKISLISAILFSVPLINLVNSSNFTLIIISKIIFALITAAFIVPFHVFYKNLFPTTERYFLSSFSYSLGKVLYSSLIPLVILLWDFYKNLQVISLVIALSGLVAFLLLASNSKANQSV